MRPLASTRGFSLIEAIIYIALFMIVIGGGVVSSYQIFEGSAQVKEMNIMEAETNFIERKLDWALNGSNVTTPAAGAEGSTLVVTRDGNTYTFTLDGTGVVTMNDGSGAEPLSSSRVTISDLIFGHVAEAAGRPASLSFSFSVNDRFVGTTTRYIR